MAPRTRPPTGQVAYPVIMVEGLHKKGKSFLVYLFTSSDLVGRCFALELGERTADEYAPLGDFEVVEHNGTYADFFGQIKECTAEPQVDGKPNVIIMDSGTMFWDLQKHKADAIARSSKRAKEILAEDPDADIETGMNAWTAVKDQWWDVINHLRAWNGITLITCRADVVAEVVNGRPTKNTVWSRQIEKGTPFQMTAIVRAQFPDPPVLTDIQSLNVSIPDGGLELPMENPLEHVVFRILGAGGRFESGRVVNPALGVPAKEAMGEVLKAAIKVAGNEKDAKEVAAAAWDAEGLRGLPEITTAQLGAVLGRISPEPPAEAAPDKAPGAQEGQDGATPPDAAGGPAEAPAATEGSTEAAPEEPDVYTRPQARDKLVEFANRFVEGAAVTELVEATWERMGLGDVAEVPALAVQTAMGVMADSVDEREEGTADPQPDPAVEADREGEPAAAGAGEGPAHAAPAKAAKPRATAAKRKPPAAPPAEALPLEDSA
jgi:hypothetical protein